VWLRLTVEGVLESEVRAEDGREAAVAMLQRLDREMMRRGKIFRDMGVRDFAAFRARRDAVPMPNMRLVVEQGGELFETDDRLAQEASLLLDRLVRQGPALGVDVNVSLD
jgi:DNA segregation ATPase FtsK/SpoIIIE-like protein